MPTGGYSGDALLGADAGCGGNTDIDGSAEALTSSTQAVAVLIKAAEDNSDSVFVQLDGTDATTSDFELGAGDSTPWLPVPGNDLANISVIGGAANQAVSFIYLR